MELLLRRDPTIDGTTLGDLSVDGRWECYSCEDAVRAVKVKGETAIPAGRYQIIITMSNRFKKPLPLLLDVPGFDGIRIHTGNTAEDTEGCILVGQDQEGNTITHSRDAFAQLFNKLRSALDRHEEIWITVENSA